MIVDLIWLFFGLGLVLFGANGLVDGSISIARRARVSEFVIGMTIVGIGTSVPEMVVSFTAAFAHNADISIGNILGSNIFNAFCIIGCSALILPLVLTRSNLRRDIPVHLLTVLVFLLLSLDKTLGLGAENRLSRLDGLLMLLLYAVYMYFSFRQKEPETDVEETKVRKLGIALVMVVVGIAGLVLGGRLFVRGATAVARDIGISDKFIAVTILALGTSMPEFAASTVAAFKGKGQLALGNVIGSNVANILLVLGGSALIYPLGMPNPADITNPSGINFVDLGVLLLSALILLGYTLFRGRKISRFGGFCLLATYGGYLTWLLMHLT